MKLVLPSFFVKEHRRELAIVIITSVIANLLVLNGSLYMMLVYDSVLPSHSVETLLGLFAIAAMLYAFQAVFDMIRSRALHDVANAVHEEFSPAVHYAAVNRKLKGVAAEGDDMQPLRDLDIVHSFLVGNGPVAFIDFPWVLLFMLVLFILHFWLGVTALFGVIVLTALTYWTSRATQEGTRELARVAARRGTFSASAVRFRETTTAMGMQGRLQAETTGWNRQYLAAQSSLAKVVAQMGGSGRVFRIFLQSMMLTVGALLVIDGKASGGIIIASSILGGRALAPVDQLIGNWKGYASARDGWIRLTELLQKVQQPEPVRVALGPPRRVLSVHDLWVAPPGAGRFAVGGVSFTLNAGEALGIVGRSAAGKTSLAKALLGVWPAARGSVRLDGATYDQWDREVLGRSLGYVSQHVEIFEGSIGQNIARLDPDASSAAVIAAARAAGMHDLIVGLDKGYETPLSVGGNELSAGQQQRLGLARALYGDPFLVVLDEPNSNLDAEGDAALAQAILDIRKRGGIAIMITHRPAALAPVSHVMILQNGTMQSFGERDKVLAENLPGTVPQPAQRPGLVHGASGAQA